jgi:PST family polysaccharide transporter
LIQRKLAWQFLQNSKWLIVSTLIKLGSSLIFNKIMAIFLGTTGITLFAHVMDLFNLTLAVPQEGVHKGTIQVLSKRNLTPTKKGSYVGMAILMNVGSFIVVGAYLLLFHQSFFTLFTFGISSLVWGAIFLIATFAYLIHVFLLLFWQIEEDFQRLSILSVLGNLLAICLLVIFTKWFPSYSLLAFPLGLGCSVIFSFLFTFRLIKQNYSPINFKWNTDSFQDLGSFLLMAISFLLFERAVSFGVREYSIYYFNSENTGFWQSVATISTYYSGAFTAIVMAVFYPQITKLIPEKAKLSQYLKSTFGMVVLGLIAGLVLVYLLRRLIMGIIFTDEFVIASDLFRFQLLGDFFRLSGFLLGGLLLAQVRIKAYLAVQAISAIAYLVAIPLLVNDWQLETFPLAHLIRSLVGFCLLLFFTRKALFGNGNP